MTLRNMFSFSVVFSLLLACYALADSYVPYTTHDVDLLDNDHVFVTDGGSMGIGGSGIYEIDRDGSIVWVYASNLDWAHNADRETDGRVIISDTEQDRVIVVDSAGAMLWNSDDVSLSDGSALNYPNDANLLPSGNILITDRDHHRVFEITPAGNVVWQFGQTGVPGGGANRLNGPHNADRLSNGNTIIVDSNNNRVIEVTPANAIVWTYAGGLNWPRDADRLANGNTLVDDSNNHRIIEVTPGGATVWSYSVSGTSYDADRLASGNTLLSTTGSILEVNSSGVVVWSYPPVYTTEVIEGYLVTAPNGNRLWTRIIQPRADLYPGRTFPAVVNVPGGLGAGENGNANLAARGFVEIHFNAEGRGQLHRSDGVENHNGFLHQDDLKAIIEHAASRGNVDAENIGVLTNSYGITMGAGVLGRYPNLPVKYLVDNEGPSESFVTDFEPWSLDGDPSNDRLQQGYNVFGHWSIYRDSSAANIAWWSEREATRFIGNIRCRYTRVQAQWDHAQPPNAQWPGFDYPPLWFPCKHTVDMINLATTGQSPWTRVNGLAIGNPIGQTYSREAPPNYYGQNMQSHSGEVQHIVQEMAAMPTLLRSVDDLTVYPLETSLLLRWTAVPFATTYAVYRLTHSDDPPESGALIGQTATTEMTLENELTNYAMAFYVVVATRE